MSKMLESKRATRGLRMADLVGQAAEDDEQFWGNEVWNEDEDGSDAESFEEDEEEVKPDEFDSDFNDTETEEESGSDDEKKMQKSARAQQVKSTKATNVYKDPTTGGSSNRVAPKRRQTDENGEPVPKRKLVEAYDGPMERSVRDSTKAKTVDTEEANKIRAKLQNNGKPRVHRQIKTQHYQKDLLLEALDTEESNNKWLLAQSAEDLERSQADKPAKKVSDESYIRFSSRRGTYNTVTFSMVEAMPAILRGVGGRKLNGESTSELEAPVQPVCVITGLPAKYRDPRTMLPYANAAAFKEIRRRYPNGLSGGVRHR